MFQSVIKLDKYNVYLTHQLTSFRTSKLVTCGATCFLATFVLTLNYSSTFYIHANNMSER